MAVFTHDMCNVCQFCINGFGGEPSFLLSLKILLFFRINLTILYELATNSLNVKVANSHDIVLVMKGFLNTPYQSHKLGQVKMTVGENIYLKYLILVDKDIHKMKSLSHFTNHRTLPQAI